MVPLFRSRVLITSACVVAAAGVGLPAALVGLPDVDAATHDGVVKIAPGAGAKPNTDAKPKRKPAREQPARARRGADVHDVVAAQARRVAIRARRRARRPKKVAVPPALQAIAQCESGGNPRAVSANGTYRGKYQFSRDTWAAVGGTGDPAAAPEAEQDKRAIALYNQSGPGQWPVCGQ